MLTRIQRTIEEQRLLRGVRTVLVAVSGGSDSVALFHALAAVYRRQGLHIVVGHLNHHIRGKSADADAAFVRALAGRLKVPCDIGDADVPAVARRKGISIEMAARDVRYEFLRKAAEKAGADCVATAHTADDQVETILLRLVRGAGGTGLGGIRYSATINGLSVIRPMLDVTKVDAVEFLKGIGATWREDESNSDVEFQRNMVRHELLPMLATRMNPGIRKALLQAGRILRDEDEWMDALATGILRQSTAAQHAVALRLSSFSRHPVAARRRVLRLWLSTNGVPPEAIDFDLVARIDAVARDAGGRARTCLPGGWQVAAGGGTLTIGRSQTKAPAAFRVEVKVPGETVLDRAGLRIVVKVAPGIVRDRPRGPGQMPASASLSLRTLRRRKLYVRSWRQGDRIKPFGLAGSKKIQDVFVDAKVPRDERASIPVFDCGGQVVWLPGYRIDSDWAIGNDAEPALQICVEKL